MTRVLVVGPPMHVGGTERHLAQVLPALAARGIEIGLHVLERGGVLEAPLCAAGIAVEGPEPGMGRAWRAAAMVSGLRRRIRATAPDLLHLFLPEPSLLGALAAESVGFRRYLLSRRSLAHYRAAYPGIWAMERVFIRRALGVIGNSEAVLAELLAETGQRARLGLIHNGVAVPALLSPAERRARRARIAVAEEAYLIAVVANLIPYKGHADLIAALGPIAARLPQDWVLALIGRDDGIGAALDALSLRHGLAGRVRRVGARSDAAELLAAADLAVLPTHQEGFSNALVEGMAAGIPTIATAVGGNLDAVEDGVSGLLVPVADPAALGRAILALAASPDDARRLGAAARARVSERFGEAAMLARYEMLYRRAGELGTVPLASILASAAAPHGA
ncbi:glycosyltransferase [Rhabdaerophilum calidifontis]|uniref:glycosyltransferase n=1 Tax=Rhabdaerophilum calidifontis TaxID=2604328 RepID=UPI00123A4B86|nr:glycosyltransferase [Rhabdaerophilum calidifontis]